MYGIVFCWVHLLVNAPNCTFVVDTCTSALQLSMASTSQLELHCISQPSTLLRTRHLSQVHVHHCVLLYRYIKSYRHSTGVSMAVSTIHNLCTWYWTWFYLVSLTVASLQSMDDIQSARDWNIRQYDTRHKYQHTFNNFLKVQNCNLHC